MENGKTERDDMVTKTSRPASQKMTLYLEDITISEYLRKITDMGSLYVLGQKLINYKRRTG
jgi:hypothetical protein